MRLSGGFDEQRQIACITQLYKYIFTYIHMYLHIYMYIIEPFLIDIPSPSCRLPLIRAY